MATCWEGAYFEYMSIMLLKKPGGEVGGEREGREEEGEDGKFIIRRIQQ